MEVRGPVFAPDGTVYIFRPITPDPGSEFHLIALDSGGNVKPGWPVEPSPGSYLSSPAVVAPDGSIYVEECRSTVAACVLHRLGADGRDLTGWPIDVPCQPGNLCYSLGPIGPDGTVYLLGGNGARGLLQLIAVDPLALDGIKTGWPIALPNLYALYSEDARVGPDGTLFIPTWPTGPDATAPTSQVPSASLSAFGPDGSSRPGWPVTAQFSGYGIGSEGGVVVWWFDPWYAPVLRTFITVLGADGQILPGWPRAVKGVASDPLVGADGTLYYVTERGNAYAHDKTGAVKAGWPMAVGRARNYPAFGTPAPYLGPDETVYFLTDEVVAVSPDGASGPSWRYRPDGVFDWTLLPGIGEEHVRPAPAFGPDGTIYVAVFHEDVTEYWAEVVALDREGDVKPGWPYRLPGSPYAGSYPASDLSGETVNSLHVTPDGRLLVAMKNMLLSLDPDGRISGR